MNHFCGEILISRFANFASNWMLAHLLDLRKLNLKHAFHILARFLRLKVFVTLQKNCKTMLIVQRSAWECKHFSYLSISQDGQLLVDSVDPLEMKRGKNISDWPSLPLRKFQPSSSVRLFSEYLSKAFTVLGWNEPILFNFQWLISYRSGHMHFKSALPQWNVRIDCGTTQAKKSCRHAVVQLQNWISTLPPKIISDPGSAPL